MPGVKQSQRSRPAGGTAAIKNRRRNLRLRSRIHAKSRNLMKKGMTAVSFLVIASMMLWVTPATALSGQSNANKSAKGEMKQGGKEAKNAGKSLGTDVKQGHVVKGGKDFGKHTANSAKHVS